jgi:hypothetical protein
MSTYNDIDLLCEKCGEEFQGTIWVAIHAGLHPELKELLLGGELNLVRCPSCGDVTFRDHFVLYQEPAAELIAYIYPESEKGRAEELRKMMLSGFQEAVKDLSGKERPGYEPILLFGLESMIELARAEEALAEQSQIAQVICKQNKLETILLRPSQARRLRTVRVIPHSGASRSPTREQILEGLDKLLQLNSALDLYAQLKRQIQENPSWDLSTISGLPNK